MSEQQWRSLGGDQPPQVNESNGKQGCDYQQGASGEGWIVFVTADKGRTVKQFADGAANSERFDLGGYPAAKVGTNKTNCLLAADVSDQGSLFVNTVAPSGNPDPCELSRQFVEAAVQNLPNA